MRTDGMDMDANQQVISKKTVADPDNHDHQPLEIALVAKSKSKPRIDTAALNGLRGFLAVYIMLVHSFAYSKWQVSILGSVWMPMFFLISGFIFGITEEKTI